MDEPPLPHDKLTTKAFARLLWQAGQAWVDHSASSMGAAVAYYTIFSLAPLLLLVIAVAGLAVGHDAARAALLLQFEGLVGPTGAQAVRVILEGASDSREGVISLILGSIALFIGATTVFAEMQRDIDLIWGNTAPPESGLWRFFKVRLLSLTLIVGVGFLLIVSFVVSAALAALGTLWGSFFSQWEVLLQLLNALVSLGVITVLFALIYKVLPSTPIAWGDVWHGAAVTSLLFTIGKFAIGMYIGKSAISSSFGAAGAFIVLILWVYYSAQIFFLGTEFTYLYAQRFGSHRHKYSAHQEQGQAPATRAEPEALQPSSGESD